MDIPEQMQIISEELIAQNGAEYIIHTQELKALLKARFGTNPDSVIPSDYCYNRVNKGIEFLKYPRLFVYVSRGNYRYLGENYPYNGPVYAKPKGSEKESIVGTWKKGVFFPIGNEFEKMDAMNLYPPGPPKDPVQYKNLSSAADEQKKKRSETIKKSSSTAMTEEKHLRICRNQKMLALYERLKKAIFNNFEDAGTGATADYVYWNVSGMRRTRQFANFYIQKNKIRILTLTPTRYYGIGENVPDTHLWVLNYQTDISSESDADKVKGIIVESYNQIEQML